MHSLLDVAQHTLLCPTPWMPPLWRYREHSGGHSNRCTSPAPHQCPPRCFHCHSPHPADYSECLLRPSVPSRPTAYTKAQITEIRHACSAALGRTRTEKGCCTPPPTPTVGQEQMAVNTDPPPPPPPPSASQKLLLSYIRAVRFINTPQPPRSILRQMGMKL